MKRYAVQLLTAREAHPELSQWEVKELVDTTRREGRISKLVNEAAQEGLGRKEQIDTLVTEAIKRIENVNPQTKPQLDAIKNDLAFALLKAAGNEDREVVRSVLELRSGQRLIRATQGLVIATCLLVLATVALVAVDIFSGG